MNIILWSDDQGRVVALTPPGGMTAEQAKKDAKLVPQDRPSFIVDNATMPGEPLVAWRLSGEGVVSVDHGALPAAPTSEEIQAAAASLETVTGMTVAQIKRALGVGD